ncbi:hypothetical protein GA0070611_1239 [Micromonospora auratinigra]|uniref:Uncharacterized protein n=2 Tax=Micromonospora auratinigra TaxID=261654 RepID=A0A1A8Z968_9ACTN|nr:hypothetical protein GA0070611_1239 [Micromonospora auratinigra]
MRQGAAAWWVGTLTGMTADTGPLQVWDLLVTAEMARQIRHWRVVEDCSYRVVARLADETWGSATGGNQLFGEDLCAAAARMSGEYLNAEPWS